MSWSTLCRERSTQRLKSRMRMWLPSSSFPLVSDGGREWTLVESWFPLQASRASRNDPRPAQEETEMGEDRS